MKIIEITEGYSITHEGWGEFKGAVARSLTRGGRAISAKLGSGKAQGQLQMDKALMGVMKNYQRYLGQTNLDQNYGSLLNYLKALGIKNPIMKENFAPGADPIKGQQGVSTKFNRNQVMQIIRNNLEAALKAGTLPKELKKFLGQ